MPYRVHSSEQIRHRVDKAYFVRLLSEHLKPDELLSAEEDVKPYECDGLSSHRARPWLVALPESIDQLRAVLGLCQTHNVPVVARGAGTGLSGGALPIDNGVLLCLSKFRRIIEIDPANRLVRVEPGVRNSAVSEAVRRYGLYYAPDPSSQIACTIGGNVAENSGGVHCLKYGLTVHNVAAAKLLTLDGELLELGSDAWDASGYDLLALVCGSEGLLGILVEVTLRLLPLPETAHTLLAGFDSVGQAGRAVADIIGAGLLPAGLEMMDNPAIRAAEQFVHAGYPSEAAALILCELDGNLAQVEADRERAHRILEDCGASTLRIATDPAERMRMWAGRKAAFPAVGRLSPDYYCMDGTIPRQRLAEVLGGIAEAGQRYGLAIANVFHAGDGNLHPLILYDANRSGELEKAEALGAEILELCVTVGGTITGEHGVGSEKIDQMCVQFSDAELNQFHRLKRAFDPAGLLNPGKAIPSLHRCAEFGAMHVRGGRLPHPELERF
ncbi:MAG: FAD-binding protein [Methylococcaceae bacterium]|nr:FAD-binding protein [Methylococcaceae bacterium]